MCDKIKTKGKLGLEIQSKAEQDQYTANATSHSSVQLLKIGCNFGSKLANV